MYDGVNSGRIVKSIPIEKYSYSLCLNTAKIYDNLKLASIPLIKMQGGKSDKQADTVLRLNEWLRNDSESRFLSYIHRLFHSMEVVSFLWRSK
ncbi:hypothetical protein SAMN05216516_102196 [Izhakiella capsodis]|uniref:Uncharacterized protein n=1 Tax=Izhakiella capsodis TaxID=1367852 RepID=A0A1I4W1E0_9GAMM|nr:hypothetical protein SAMN05216516_102196 [Izhakiella capsodis]